MAYAPQDGQSGNSQSTPQVPPKSSDVLQYEADLANALAISKEQAELEKAMALSMESARMDELRRCGYTSSGASYQSALRRSASEGKGRIQSRPRPQRPPPPSSMKQPSTQRADEPNLIDLELDFDPLKQRGGSSVSYREDLLQVFAPGTLSAASANANSTTSVDSGTTTGVSNAGNITGQSCAWPQQDPWSALSDATNPIKTKSLPNSPQLSQRQKPVSSGMLSNSQQGISTSLQHSHSGSNLEQYFHAQPQPQRAFSSSSSSAFMKYTPGVRGESSKSASWNQTHRMLLSSSLMPSNPRAPRHFTSTALPSGVVAPVPIRPRVNHQHFQANIPSRVTVQCSQPSASMLSSSAPTKNTPQTWQTFGSPDSSTFRKSVPPLSSSLSVVNTSSVKSTWQGCNVNNKMSSTKQAFVWNDRSNEAPSISVTATPDNRRPQSNDASDGAMDDILREFDVLEVNRPPRPPRPPSPLQDPNMMRLSRSENNIAANVSWMDFDPLRAGQTQSASDSSLPPSYEESQITRGVELPPSYAESEAIAKKSPSVSPTGYSESHSDNTIVKRPLSPPERPPPPKSPKKKKVPTATLR